MAARRKPLGGAFGPGSDRIAERCEMAFLPRHGRGHVHSPTTVPYRANIDALKRLGVTDVVSVSACGSFREEMAPGDFVIVDQFIDRTFAREKSFFGTGCVAHVSVAHPTCPRLSAIAADAAEAAGAKVHRGGTYLAMEGPQFSSLAESKMYREVWGCDVIGMTNMPEAKLAREAELCYASVAMITDYDSWHPDHGEVDVNEIIKTLMGNSEKGRALAAGLAGTAGTIARPVPPWLRQGAGIAVMTGPKPVTLPWWTSWMRWRGVCSTPKIRIKFSRAAVPPSSHP